MVKKFFLLIIVCIITLNFSACSSDKKSRYEAEFLMLFDTVTQIVSYNSSKEEFSDYSQLIYDNLKEYHELYDIYNSYDGINNIKTINDNAGIAPVKVDKRIIDMLLFAKEEYKNSNGKVNVAFGSVLKVWHDYRTEGIDEFENAALPSMNEIKSAAEHTDINKIIIDKNASTVFLDDPQMSIDVGAIAKGYAVERVTEIAIENGFKSGLISVGGNVRAVGKKDGNKFWNIGIQNPDKSSENKTLHKVNLSDMSLVTSGDYQRYYTVDGKNYHHIIDPVTLYPANYFTAVSIICKDSGKADSLSTALFNMSLEDGKKLINNLEDTEALWVLKNGNIEYSNNMKNFFNE